MDFDTGGLGTGSIFGGGTGIEGVGEGTEGVGEHAIKRAAILIMEKCYNHWNRYG